MNKYIVILKGEKDYTAASKARDDAEIIAKKAGFIPFRFKGGRTANRNPFLKIKLFGTTINNWIRLTRSIEAESLVLLQYPHYPMKTAYLMKRMIPIIRKLKNVRFIFLIHDLNSLRETFGKAAIYSDKYLLKQSDYLICHNDRMKEYLILEGIQSDKLIPLQLFDYLMDTQPKEHHLQDGITVAGNLDPEKSGYVSLMIRMIDEDLPVHLYGRGLEEKKEIRNIKFHGAYASEVLPGELEGAFGVVWDGPSAQTCSGPTGNYLRYNNPHKLSLYISAGLPVIIWKEAAEADFVRRNNIGLLADSLEQVQNLILNTSEEAYGKMREQTERIGREVRAGAFLTAALQWAERSLKP